MRTIVGLTAAILTCGILVAAPVRAATFSFTSGIPDGKVGALSRPASPGKLETEAADDFILQQTTVINAATITGWSPWEALEHIRDVEVFRAHVDQCSMMNVGAGLSLA
jgi:hypothetical protein